MNLRKAFEQALVKQAALLGRLEIGDKVEVKDNCSMCKYYPIMKGKTCTVVDIEDKLYVIKVPYSNTLFSMKRQDLIKI